MFNNGEIWLTEDYKIRSISYETAKGQSKRIEIIEEDRKSLPIEYQNYDRPFLKLEFLNQSVRIDEIQGNYRLMLLCNNQVQKILEMGSLQYDGNLGSYHIDWIDNDEIVRISYYTAEDNYYLEKYNRTEIEANIDAYPITKEISIRVF